MKLSVLDRADMVRALTDIRDKADALLTVLLPENGETECAHSPEHIENLSTMGEELYRCRRCGAQSQTPFPSISPEG